MNSEDLQAEQAEYLSLNWYRDADGKDITVLNNVSIGATLSYVVRATSSAILRYHHLYSQSFENGKGIQLPIDASDLEEQVARNFGVVSRCLPALEVPRTIDQALLQRDDLAIPYLARAVRICQRLLIRTIRHRSHLYLTDWTTAVRSRRDSQGLVLYRKSLTKSAIPRSSKRYRRSAQNTFPREIDKWISTRAFTECLSKIGAQWDDYILETLSIYMANSYQKVREQLTEITAQWTEMLDFYQPLRVALPADCSENWIIMYQLCRVRGIETTLFTDGYNPVPQWPVLRTEDNSDWLATRVAAFGTGHKEMVSSLGFPEERIDLIDPPFLSNKKSTNKRVGFFDAVVLTWSIYQCSPRADVTSPRRTLKSVLETLRKRGFTQVAVKVRYSGELAYVRSVIKELNMSVEVLQGRLVAYLDSTDIFIGGISGAFAEVTGHGATYILFEPDENGYTDHMISQSPVIERGLVARNEFELNNLLTNPRSSWAGDPNHKLRVFPSR